MTSRTGPKACNFCTNTPVSFQHGEGDAAVLACLRCEDMIKDAAWDAWHCVGSCDGPPTGCPT